MGVLHKTLNLLRSVGDVHWGGGLATDSLKTLRSGLGKEKESGEYQGEENAHVKTWSREKKEVF